jgi:phosphopantetheinyl transferase (holo-ACP synthase)
MNFLCVFIVLTLNAQENKDEKESKLTEKEVPAKLRLLISDFQDVAKHVDYFLEINEEKKSYEVKLLYKKSYYSIECNDSLKLEDVEVIIREKEIEPALLDKFNEYLSKYDKFQIDKIQKQFSSKKWSDKEVVRKALEHGTGDTINYEIEASVKSDGKWKALEILFSAEGKFISQKEIVKRSSDFILY